MYQPEVIALLSVRQAGTTLAERLSPINAAMLRRAHALTESGRAMGKIVVEG